MSPKVSERSFEEAIECGLLQHGPDACPGDATLAREVAPPFESTETRPEGDFFVRSAPGTVKLSPEDTREYIRTRFPGHSPA